MFDDIPSLTSVLIRFAHIMFGIVWLGHLYFFNLVNVPFQADLDKELKPKVNPKLLLRAFWWFRWGAMITFLSGWIYLLHYWLGIRGINDPGTWKILLGGLLGTIMWANVWFVIWPRQKLILGGMAAEPGKWSDEICAHNALTAVLGPQPALLPDLPNPYVVSNPNGQRAAAQ